LSWLNYLLIIPIFIKLNVMIAWFSLLFLFKKRRAVSRFKRTLISSGIGKKEADLLGKNYPFKLSDVINLIERREGW